MKSINFAQLRAFHAVAIEGGFTKAARVLNVSQPTLSQEVKALEETHGVRLLERGKRSVTTTPAGETLLAAARRLFAAEQEVLQLLAGAHHLEGGTLALGADSPMHAMPLLAAFTRRHPGPKVTVTMGNSATLLAGLFDSRLDVAVLADAPGDGRLYVMPLRRDPVCALLPAKHPLARRRSLRLSDLAGETLLLREQGSMTRRLVEQALHEAEVEGAARLVIATREAVMEATAQGLGVGFVSEAEFTGDPRLVLRPFSDARIEMDEFVVCLRDRRRLGVVRAFVEVAKELAAQEGAATHA